MKRNRTPFNNRIASRGKGSVATLAFVAMLPLVAALGGFAVDCMHVNDAKGELQRATDAAALAGAEDLKNYNGSNPNLKSTASSVDLANNQEPVNFALQVAQLNAVDGPVGLWQNANRSVTATIRYDATLPGPTNIPNRCDVTGSIQTQSIFAQIFGNFGQSVGTSSSAGLQVANTVYNYVPLLVSVQDSNSLGNALQNQAAGATFRVDVKVNSIWAINDNNTLTKIIAALAGGTFPGSSLEPAVSVGGQITSDNGVKSAGQDFGNLVITPPITVIFPVTGDSVGTGQPKHTVTGFFAMQVTSAGTSPPDYYLSGTIVPVSTFGSGQGTSLSTPFATSGDVVTRACLIQ
jgi:hypothetical protein